MDAKVKGLVLYSKDTGESDKFVTILTPNMGKIFFKARGVKKATSKLKAYVQSFSFCDFELNEKKGNYTLTGATCIENFFKLTTDLDKYNMACVVLEVLDKVCVVVQNYYKTFLSALKVLDRLSYSEIDGKILLCKFLLEVLINEGFAFNTEYCSSCKKPLKEKVYYDISGNAFTCENCKDMNSIEVKPVTLSSIKILSNCDYEQLKTVKLKDFIVDGLLRFLVGVFNNTFETRLKTLSLLS